MCRSNGIRKWPTRQKRWKSYQKLKTENDYHKNKESYLASKKKREKEISKMIKKLSVKK